MINIENEFRIKKTEKAGIISVTCPGLIGHETESETTRSLVELKELLRTLEIPVVKKWVQNRKSIESATFIGKGKLIEMAEVAKQEGISILVFDADLTASQVNNIKEITGLTAIDRCQVILEIFAEHARTREAKIQIEISRLQYLLPRLAGLWGHFSRQGGGVGVRGGEGEQQIELDRRMIRKRIEFLREQLKEVEVSRKEQRKRRQQKAITAALVGYTNAGKSSLMNRLCRVNVLEENKLFATIDATFRMLNPDTKPPMILIDTVGFISNLPNTLIDGFKSTLESALEADLLLIVVDVSDPNFQNHLKVTDEVLNELGIGDKDRMIIFNKRDLLEDQMKGKIIKRAYANSFLVTSNNTDDMSELRKAIINYFLAKQSPHDLYVPYEDGLAHSEILSKANIINQEHHEKGVFYRIRTPDFIFQQLSVKKYLLSPEESIHYQQMPKEGP
jgi:GTP-binding protein HflX